MTRRLTIKLPSLVSTQEFQPTGLMIRTICAYLQALDANKDISPPQILTELGKHSSNWYKWRKKPNFQKWWLKAVEEYHSGVGLAKIHSKLFKYAQMPANHPDRKLYLERFDKDYKPSTAQDISFPGIAPPSDIPGAVERSRQLAEQHRAEQDAAQKVKTVDNRVIDSAEQKQIEPGPDQRGHEEKKDSNTDQPDQHPHPPFLRGSDLI